jgi:hypothetical protein
MLTQKIWTLNLTPADAPAVTLTDVPHDEVYAVFRAMMAGESAAAAATRVTDAARDAA